MHPFRLAICCTLAACTQLMVADASRTIVLQSASQPEDNGTSSGDESIENTHQKKKHTHPRHRQSKKRSLKKKIEAEAKGETKEEASKRGQSQRQSQSRSKPKSQSLPSPRDKVSDDEQGNIARPSSEPPSLTPTFIGSFSAPAIKASTPEETDSDSPPSEEPVVFIPKHKNAYIKKIGEIQEVPAGCKKIFFVRHAEGNHQAAQENSKRDRKRKAHVVESFGGKAVSEREKTARMRTWAYHYRNPNAEQLIDSVLTRTGEKQCIANKEAMPEVDLVVVSPLRRTLQTAYLLFGNSSAYTDKQFLVHEICREKYGTYTSDKRRKMSANQKWKPLSWTEDGDVWKNWDWQTQKNEPPNDERPSDMAYSNEDSVWSSRESSTHIKERASTLLKFLLSRSETSIAVVTHAMFMKTVFDNEGSGLPSNAEAVETLVCPPDE